MFISETARDIKVLEKGNYISRLTCSFTILKGYYIILSITTIIIMIMIS